MCSSYVQCFGILIQVDHSSDLTKKLILWFGHSVASTSHYALACCWLLAYIDVSRHASVCSFAHFAPAAVYILLICVKFMSFYGGRRVRIFCSVSFYVLL